MKFFSTRNKKEIYHFDQVLIKSTAKDGGLFVPENLPHVDQKTIKRWAKLDYIDLAVEVIYLFSNIRKPVLRKLIKKAYQEFKTPICPVRKLANQLYIEQLFQGPTLAFKDYALSLLGQVCDYILKKGKLKKQIFCATSGDTGPAAIHGFKNCDNIDITVYFPDKNVSKLQRQQMMGVKKSNVHAIPMKGSFDDAQALVKKLFLVDKQDKLMAVNSINIGRIIAQMVYYIYAVLQFNNTKTCFYVPSGNFGNILAGYMAKCLGFNIELAIVVNDNDTLARFAKTGIFKPSKTIMTDASAMDIANPSNFERILWYLSGNDRFVQKCMRDLKTKGQYQVPKAFLKKYNACFKTFVCKQKAIKINQKEFKQRYHIDICPHTAVAYGGYKQDKQKDINQVIIATANPIKFR